MERLVSKQFSSCFQHFSRSTYIGPRLLLRRSFQQHATTFLVSKARSIFFSHYLSIVLNNLASVGMFLAISPLVKTNTRLVHKVQTLSHFSIISATSDKSAILSVTSYLNGVTYFIAFIQLRVPRSASNFSYRSIMLPPSVHGASTPFHVLISSSATSQDAVISSRSCFSNLNYLSAESVISSISSLKDRSGHLNSQLRLKVSDAYGISYLTRAITSSQ